MKRQLVDNFQLKDGREIFFRYPKIEDAEDMTRYINTLSKEQTFIRFQGEQLTLDQETEYLSKLLKKIQENTAVQILAFYQNKLIAITEISLGIGVEKHVGTFGITVAYEFRGLGIGKKMMQSVLDKAKSLSGLKIITLGCFSDNEVAQKMYEDFGFKKFGSLPGGVMHKEHFDDHIYMYKRVR